MKKVARLFPLLGLDFAAEADRAFFTKLTTFGVIAGGAMVYALNKALSRNVVGDIDVYILSGGGPFADVYAFADRSVPALGNACFASRNFRFPKDTFYDDASLIAFAATIDLLCSRLVDPVVTTMDNEDYVCVGMVPLIVMVESARAKPVQVILLRRETNVLSLLNRFDLSYVKCAFHRGAIVITAEALAAHKTGRVNLGRHVYKKTRLDKLTNKGFRCVNADMPHCVGRVDVDEKCFVAAERGYFPSDIDIGFYHGWGFDFHPRDGGSSTSAMKNLIECVCTVQKALEWHGMHPPSPNFRNLYHTSLLLHLNPLGTPALNNVLAEFCNGFDVEYAANNLDAEQCTMALRGLAGLTDKSQIGDSQLRLYRVLEFLAGFVDVLEICRMNTGILSFLAVLKEKKVLRVDGFQAAFAAAAV